MTRKIVSLLLCAMMIVTSLITGVTVSAADEQRFVDVKPGNWFYEAVEYVASKGIVDGMGDGKFKPKNQMTRAQFVTILARLAGADVKGLGATLNFTDIKGTEWFADYVGWSVKTGLVGGYPEGDFRANKAISRQELAKLFVSYMDYIGYEIKNPTPLTEKFTDAKKLPSWSKEYIEGLRACGLIGGDAEGNFNPTATATRAEVATILQRFLETEPDAMYAAQQHF
ncbi:MAG: S-layer homology domain-containing protein, partial [Clostridia bacterium]|nr:S-layer homology domain-containing protein [Clostridia bacterium]